MSDVKKQAYLDSLSKKVSAAGVIFFNDAGEMLIVQPSYKDKWEIPGGMVEDMESPKSAAQREVMEEIGIDQKPGRLLCIDYTDVSVELDSYQLLFDGGVLPQEVIDRIELCADEMKAYRFAAPEAALELLNDAVAKRVKVALQALANNTTYNMEYGQIA